MDRRVIAAFVVLLPLLAAVPLLKLPAFYETFLYLVLHWIVLATSWNILSGYSGYFSFGHGAFFGVGIYTTAVLAGKLNWPFLATLPVAALISALFGVGLGAIVFRLRRLRGELFGLLTLAVTFVIGTIILNTPIDGGPGVYLSAVPVPAIGTTPSGSFYLIILALAALMLWVAYWIYCNRLGSALFAIHDDEDVAEVVSKWTGIPMSKLMQAEVEKLIHMEDYLKEHVVGQDDAVSLIANAVRRSRSARSRSRSAVRRTTSSFASRSGLSGSTVRAYR